MLIKSVLAVRAICQHTLSQSHTPQEIQIILYTFDARLKKKVSPPPKKKKERKSRGLSLKSTGHKICAQKFACHRTCPKGPPGHKTCPQSPLIGGTVSHNPLFGGLVPKVRPSGLPQHVSHAYQRTCPTRPAPDRRTRPTHPAIRAPVEPWGGRRHSRRAPTPAPTGSGSRRPDRPPG